MSVRVVFYGTPDIARSVLARLIADTRYRVCAVVTQPDRPAGRGGKSTPSPVKNLASEHGIPVLQPERIKKSVNEFQESLRAHGPFDIGVVIAFGQILPLEVLQFPRQGCVNIHASLLPRWRGAAPIQRAIMEGDQETGVCLMHMDQGLDTGAVYARARIAIDAQETFGSLHDKIAQVGAELLVSELFEIAQGNRRAEAQPQAGVTYAQKIENSEAEIDWSKDAVEIERLVRGLSPVPGAFTAIEGKRLKIFQGVAQEAASAGNPGTAIATASGFSVRCGKGSLEVLEVQLEGKKRISVSEFIKGNRIPEILG